MGLNEFREAKLKHLLWAIQGYQDRRFADVKASWEQARFIGYMSLSIAKAMGGKGGNVKIQDVLPFPWEEEVEKQYRIMQKEGPEAVDKYFSHVLKNQEDGAERRDD